MGRPLMSPRRSSGPAVEFAGMDLGAKTLDPSVEHTCHIVLKNPTSKDWTFDASLTLSGPESWSRDSGNKTCPAGGTQTYDVTVPAGEVSEGTYDIMFRVYCKETDEWLTDLQDTGQDVTFKVPVSPEVSFVSLSWD